MTATDLEMTTATGRYGVEGRASIRDNDALDDEGIAEHSYQIGTDVAAFAGPGVALTGADAITKTIHMHDRDFVFGDGSSGFRLTDMSVTVTKMTNPSTGRVYLSIFFNYSKTSLGWRTGAGPGQTVGVPQGLYFRNKDGGTIWSWGFPYDDIRVQCGDNRVLHSHHIVSQTDVSWFEVWKKVGHSFSGTLYSC